MYVGKAELEILTCRVRPAIMEGSGFEFVADAAHSENVFGL
jgi:hypothetical protein